MIDCAQYGLLNYSHFEQVGLVRRRCAVSNFEATQVQAHHKESRYLGAVTYTIKDFNDLFSS